VSIELALNNGKYRWKTQRVFNLSLPARRYVSAGLCDSNVSLPPSVCLSVHHTPVLYQNEES